MTTSETFISYAQNGEDVVLWRALGRLSEGRYVDVGANDPVDDSVTKAFYDRGWSGIDVEPMPDVAQRLRDARPRNVVVEAAVTARSGEGVVLHEVPGTGLSTLDDDVANAHASHGLETHDRTVAALRLDQIVAKHGYDEGDVHFLKVDVEGSEADVLESVDLEAWRPWVLVIESTAPNSSVPTHEEWERQVLAAGYVFCLFDGLSRFYVAEEHADALRPALSYPACILDGFEAARLHKVIDERGTLSTALDEATVERARLELRSSELEEELVHWRGAVLARFADAAASGAASSEVRRLRRELDELHHTLSWRVTAPLRGVRRVQRRIGGNA